jgi:DNA-binding TFAR19-related protein (PDSD5 family)
MSALPTPDVALVSRFRATVAHALTERTTAAERSGGKPIDLDDQQALARRFLNDELERYASERMAAGMVLLTEGDEEALAQSVFDRLFALGRLQALIDDERFTDIMVTMKRSCPP